MDTKTSGDVAKQVTCLETLSLSITAREDVKTTRSHLAGHTK